MSLKVEIDSHSGFCFGVTKAVLGAERHIEEMKGRTLYSLGSIVHNEEELQRLKNLGLDSLKNEDIKNLFPGDSVLIRAHGEPPETYRQAEEKRLKILDYTCPVVLHLQRRIRKAYEDLRPLSGQIILFGKPGHAEVLGLVGQAEGNVTVIESVKMYEDLRENLKPEFVNPVAVFSQTTKSPKDFKELCDMIARDMQDVNFDKYGFLDFDELKRVLNKDGLLKINNTICNQVSNRHKALTDFALSHDVIVFVSGRESSNGKVLFSLCKESNPRSYMAGNAEEIDESWFKDGDFVGVCGATSTPKWLLESVAEKILFLL